MNLEHTHVVNDYETKILGQSEYQTDICIDLFVFNSSKYLLLTLDYKVLPVSWFITDSEGRVIRNGNTSLSHYFINISSLDVGRYSMRLLGEKYDFEIKCSFQNHVL